MFGMLAAKNLGKIIFPSCITNLDISAVENNETGHLRERSQPENVRKTIKEFVENIFIETSTLTVSMFRNAKQDILSVYCVA